VDLLDCGSVFAEDAVLEFRGQGMQGVVDGVTVDRVEERVELIPVYYCTIVLLILLDCC